MSKASTVLGFGALIAATLAGCAKDIKPTGPVLTPFERGRDFATTAMAPARYSTGIPPLTKVPVLPFMGFGANFDVDVTLGTKSDDFDMIQVARTQTADGPMWVVIETAAETKAQTLLASIEDINTWMPELPLERKTTALVVQDKTTSDGLDLAVKYDNSDNRPVEMTLQGQPADKVSRKRNGNAMGHSANELLLLRDVSSAESLFLADVRIDDERVRARKLGLISPFQFTTTSAMGGIATGEFFQMPVADIDWAAGDRQATAEWIPAAPPAPEPVIPGPMNLPPEEIVLLPMDEWTPLADDVKAAALEAQEAKVESCIAAGMAANPDYKGVVAVDMFVANGAAYQVTVDSMSTGAELVMTCAQTIAASWTFEAAEGEDPIEGGLRVMIGSLPEGHEAKNALETAWLDAEMARKEAAGEEMPEEPTEVPDGEELPDEGDMDLLDGDDDAEPLMEDEAAKSMVSPVSTFDTVHTMPNGQKIAQRWDIERRGGQLWVSQTSNSRTLSYEFLVKGDNSTLELRSIQVTPWGQAVPTTAISFAPALPDLRRPFNGKVESKFVIDIAGQPSYATGVAVSSFGDAGAKVALTPTAPDWAAARPIVSTVNFRDGMPYVSTRRKE